MFANWILTNFQDYILEKTPDEMSSIHFDKTSFFFSTTLKVIRNKEIVICIDGHIIPRIKYFRDYSYLSQGDIILKLYEKYKLNFLNYIKGSFNIIIIDNDRFYIVNDHSGIKKFFHYEKDNDFIISNKLKIVTDYIQPTINKESVALFCLMEHFVDGNSIFKNIFFSTSATKISYKNGKLSLSTYWNSDDLLKKRIRDYTFQEFAERFTKNISNYLDYFQPQAITMTLTGGNDSRTILAALLNLGIKPNAFCFGNQESYDCVVAKKIISKIGLSFNNHFVEHPNANWFRKKGEEIIPLGNSLINIHRAHRLDAIEREREINPDVDMIFCGFMGGDYIRGINLDDYITPKLVRLWWYDRTDKKQIIINLLKEKYLKPECFDIDKLYKVISLQKYINGNNQKTNEFYLNQELVGPIHDAQDINVFDAHIKYVVNAFMDIDFLELLFSSKFSMMFKNHTSRKYLKRINEPALVCNMIDYLAPELGDIEFAKHYSPQEFLGNKLKYILKRICRYYFSRKYPENFPYTVWFKDFVLNELMHIDKKMLEYVDNNSILKVLDNVTCFTDIKLEGDWHRFTNIINLSYILNHYSE